MSWPLSQDYNEAIQSPRSSFADPDLRRGEAACNALGLPMPYSGNFADVYQVRCPDGKSWAVKCFTREAAGLRERYQEIATHLRRAKLPFTVDFTYLEQGIRVAGKWFPALKMQWVEGLTLNQFLAQSLDKPAMLQALLQVWGRMAKHLRAAEVGHCDLQHGNVLMVPGASANSLALKLIDYDGMWVPGLAGTKSGEVGHPSYQHPRRLKEGTYNIEVDRFPLLLVATSLLALKAKGKELWDRYDNGDNLLFKETDLREPLKSHLFLDLTKIDDPAIKPMVDQLVKALRGGLETTPLLEEVTPEARPAPTTSSRPSRLATTASGKAAALTSPPAAPLAPVAPVVAGAIDFAELSPNSDRPKRKRTKANAAVHVAGWVGGGVALVFVAATVVGLAVRAMSDSPNDTKQGTPPPAPPSKPKTDGFKSLLDGKDFSEWTVDLGNRRQWTVADDVIVGHSGDSQTSTHLLSPNEYGDFTLRLDFMVELGSRGGIDLRALPREKMPVGNDFFNGDHPRFALSDPAKFPDDPSGTTYWVKEDKMDCQPAKDPQLPANKWYKLEITVRGDACTGFLEGERVVDIRLDPQSGDATVPALKRTKGRIGFQANTGTIRFRDIEIKELTPAVANPNNQPVDQSKDASTREIAKAKETFDAAMKKAEQDLLASFDREIEALPNAKVIAEMRLRLLDLRKEEKAAFEKDGTIPWSPHMRPVALEYLRARTAAERQLQLAYDEATDRAVKARDEKRARELRAEKETILKPKLVGTWECTGVNFQAVFTWELYSNGKLTLDAENPDSWDFAEGNKLILGINRADAPNGKWIDTCIIDADGKSWTAMNQLGGTYQAKLIRQP